MKILILNKTFQQLVEESIDNIDSINKAILNDLEKAETWSKRLMKMYPNARWITIKGRHVLIKLNKDKTATIVYSGDKSLEHLKIIPREHPEYKKYLEEWAKKKKAKQKLKYKKQNEPITVDELEDKKPTSEPEDDMETELDDEGKKKKILIKHKRKWREELQQKLSKTYGIEYNNLGTKKSEKIRVKPSVLDTENIPKHQQLNSVVKEVNDAIYKLKKTKGRDANEKIENKSRAKQLKDMFNEALRLHAEQHLANGFAHELIGERMTDYIGEKFTSGVKELDDAVNNLKLSDEQALHIVKNFSEYSEKIKAARKYLNENESVLKNSKVNLDKNIKLPTNWDSREYLTSKSIKNIDNRLRALMNLQFYSAIDTLRPDINKEKTFDGAFETVDALTENYFPGKLISRDMIGYMGVNNTAKFIAYGIRKTHGAIKRKKILKDLKNYMRFGSDAVVMDALKKASKSLSMAKECQFGVNKSELSDTTGRLQIGKFLSNASNHLSTAAGSLSLVASVVDNLSTKKVRPSARDIIFKSQNELTNLKNKLEQFGLSKDDYFLEKQGAGYQVTIPREKYYKVFRKADIQRDADNQRWLSKLKKKEIGEDGKEKSLGFFPKGARKDAFDWLTKEQLEEELSNGVAIKNKDGSYNIGKVKYSPYENKKGEDGYTSQKEVGTTLYKTPVHFELKPAQQRMALFNLRQKRAILDGKPGIGKTTTTYSITQELKNKKKINYSLYSPPQRLVDEAMKDAEKFFPGLKVGIIRDKNQKAIDLLKQAQKGKVDVVLIGHDTLKKMPELIKEYKPDHFSMDEAHEVFGLSDPKAETKKFKVLKDLAQNHCEYLSLMTGTPIKHGLNELCTMASVARPDIIKDPHSFVKHYGKLNQGTTIFQNEAINKFRNDLNEVIITEQNELPIKVHTDDSVIPITTEQRKRYKKIEHVYDLMNHPKNNNKFVIVNKKTGLPLTIGSGKNTQLKFANAKYKQLSNSNLRDKWLKNNGYSLKDYTMRISGQEGAAALRDKLHYKNLQDGDIETNAKLLKFADRFSKHKDKKHIVHYTGEDAKKGVVEVLKKKLGLKDEHIRYIDSSINKTGREKAKVDFMNDPNVKVILLSDIGGTGINLQRGDVTHHMDRAKTAALQDQKNARNVRTGREKFGSENHIYYYDTNTPFDQLKLNMIEKKHHIGHAVGNPSEDISIRRNVRRLSREYRNKKQRRDFIKKYVMANESIYNDRSFIGVPIKENVKPKQKIAA